MEFLRFGSSIPGSYWGCCACCIIQNFKVNPRDKASIQLVSGDGGGPLVSDGEMLFAGPTWEDIFWQRIRTGTFERGDMPNHAFFAILTEDQINGSIGKKWLAVLKEAGFEFVRSVSNSVYGGTGLAPPSGQGLYLNHIFALYRNIGYGAPEDPFTPPKEWQDLPSVKTEAWRALSDPQFADVGPTDLAQTQYTEDRAIWDRIGPPKFLKESEVVAAGAPVILAGLRSENPQEPKEAREARKAKTVKPTKLTAPAQPWLVPSA